MKAYKKMTNSEKLACLSIPKITKGVLKDENWYIRQDAYRRLGFTKEALNDEDWDIRIRAKLYFILTKGE